MANTLEYIDIINNEKLFINPKDSYIRIENFAVTEDKSDYNGERISVMAEVVSKRPDGREITSVAAVSSFIVGQDYEQSADIVISPSEEAKFYTVGPNLMLQVRYSKFN